MDTSQSSTPISLSRDTVEFLLLVLGKVNLSVSDADFEDLALKCARVKKEIREALDATTDD